MKIFLAKSINNFISHSFFFLLFIAITSQIFFGNKGLIKYYSLKSELECTYLQLEETRIEKVCLTRQIDSLKSTSLDIDLLDEKARKILNLVKPAEVILIPNR